MIETHRSYDPSYFAYLGAIEDQHFWFRARNKVIATLVRQIISNLPSGYRVLEVGCGTGNVLRVLERACPRGIVIGMDLFAEGLQYARLRTSCPLVQGDIHMLPFNTQFELICFFDVLEHLPDDRLVLRNLHAMLAIGGALVLTVPAHLSLWSYFDEASHHCRRYELNELKRTLIQTGYRVQYLTQYMASIFPLVWMGRRLAGLINRRPAGDAGRTDSLTLAELRIVPWVNELLAFLLDLETRVIARRQLLPFGTSLLAVVCKEPVSAG